MANIEKITSSIDMPCKGAKDNSFLFDYFTLIITPNSRFVRLFNDILQFILNNGNRIWIIESLHISKLMAVIRNNITNFGLFVTQIYVKCQNILFLVKKVLIFPFSRLFILTL